MTGIKRFIFIIIYLFVCVSGSTVVVVDINGARRQIPPWGVPLPWITENPAGFSLPLRKIGPHRRSRSVSAQLTDFRLDQPAATHDATPQMLAFGILGGTMILFIWGRVRYDLVVVLEKRRFPPSSPRRRT